MLLSHLNNLLVAGGAAVAEPRAVAAMGDGALPVRRRPSEHHSVCHPGFLRPSALSLLCPDTSPVRSLGATRPSRGGSHHVGPGRVRLRVSGSGHCHPLSFQAFRASLQCAPARNKERFPADESPSLRSKFPLLADFLRPRLQRQNGRDGLVCGCVRRNRIVLLIPDRNFVRR